MKRLLRGVAFFISLLFLVPASTLTAQTGKVRIDMELDAALKAHAKDIQGLMVFLSKGTESDSKKYFYRDRSLDKWQDSLHFDALPAGAYTVSISGAYAIFHDGQVYFHYLKTAKVANVDVKENGETIVKCKFPGDCIYNKDFSDRKCPKCHKSDKVITLVHGDPIIDPHTGEPTAKHVQWATSEVSGCDPAWYCDRDKLEF